MIKLKTILSEGNIKDDVKLFLQDLIDKNIITRGYISSTGHGAKSKNKLFVETDNLSYDDFTKLIKSNYKQTGSSKLSSKVYYSPKGSVFFYYYKNNGKFEIVVRRNNLGKND